MSYISVEAKDRYRSSFRPYCSQHKGSFVFNTKGLLFSSIYVNIVLFSTQRVFCFQVFMYCSRYKGSFVLDICVNIVLFSIQRVFYIKHLCQYCIVLNTHKGVMTSNDVRKECLECHMTSNDVKG